MLGALPGPGDGTPESRDIDPTRALEHRTHRPLGRTDLYGASGKREVSEWPGFFVELKDASEEGAWA